MVVEADVPLEALAQVGVILELSPVYQLGLQRVEERFGVGVVAG